jgi:Set1/Ash2 histone methyltransferase complex subunit ASH2
VTKKAELQAPIGYDQHGYCYRDLEGSKVHKALREPYGESFSEGDVIGLFIHIPHTDMSLDESKKTVTKWKGTYYYVDEPPAEQAPMVGAVVGFSKNGKFQGVAYKDFLGAVYYPAASIYSMPEQTDGATVTFNFGPDFLHSPPVLPDCPVAQPMSSRAAQEAQVVKAGDEGGATAAAPAASVPSPME